MRGSERWLSGLNLKKNSLLAINVGGGEKFAVSGVYTILPSVPSPAVCYQARIRWMQSSNPILVFKTSPYE